MTTQHTARPASEPRKLGYLGMCLALLGSLPACSSLLDVDLPGAVEAATLDDPDLMPIVVNGAISGFECAFSMYAAATAVIGDEYVQSDALAVSFPWEHRQLTPDTPDLASAPCDVGAGFGVYTPMQTARFAADDAVRRLEGFSDAEVPNRASLIATSAAYAGYGLIMMGEGFCEMAVDGGPLLSRPDVFALADERFTKALQQAQSAGNADILNLALVGRARARLNLGLATEAAADAGQVATGYTKLVTRGTETGRRINRVGDRNQGGSVTVHPRFRAMTFGGVPDSRVQVVFSGFKGSNTIHDMYLALKYVVPGNAVATRSAPIRFASWDEAQLILAEAAGGQTAVDIINVLHAAASLPPFASNDPAEIMAQVIDERSRELFLEGYRLGDMLRYDLPFDATHPAEDDHVAYGTSTCMPLPNVERGGNPNL